MDPADSLIFSPISMYIVQMSSIGVRKKMMEASPAKYSAVSSTKVHAARVESTTLWIRPNSRLMGRAQTKPMSQIAGMDLRARDTLESLCFVVRKGWQMAR